MIKKLAFAICLMLANTAIVFADVDVNKGDQAAFDGIKGLGPSTSKAIIAERNKAGEFKDWPDFQARVKGVAEKRATNLSEAGLTVNGLSKPILTVTSLNETKTDESASASAKAMTSK